MTLPTDITRVPRRERLQLLWHRLRLAVAEMNYATRRMVELEAFPDNNPLH